MHGISNHLLDERFNKNKLFHLGLDTSKGKATMIREERFVIRKYS